MFIIVSITKVCDTKMSVNFILYMYLCSRKQ